MLFTAGSVLCFANGSYVLCGFYLWCLLLGVVLFIAWGYVFCLLRVVVLTAEVMSICDIAGVVVKF